MISRPVGLSPSLKVVHESKAGRMKKGDAFLTGQVFRILNMPDGGMMFTLSLPRPPEDFAAVELINHNVFRVDASGEVMWQITREDAPGYNWEAAHENARKRGLQGRILPFVSFFLEFADGSIEPEANPPDEMSYVPDSQVNLMCLGHVYTRLYRLDVETGRAVETTPSHLAI